MAKDRIHYRNAKRRAQNLLLEEQAAGITTSCTASINGGSRNDVAQRLEQRPVGLLKWSYDDLCVEEILPAAFVEEQVEQGEAAGSPHGSVLLKIVSEGVPDATVERQLRQLLGKTVSMHFLTPLDVVSSTSRYLWVRASASQVESALRCPRQCFTSYGTFFVTECLRLRLDHRQPLFPLRYLPSLQYTVVLRDIRCSLADILPALRMIESTGFINYNHMARHGLAVHQTFEDAKLLLQRQYLTFAQHYVKSLTEGAYYTQREVDTLVEIMADGRTTVRNWRNAAESIQQALSQDEEVMRKPQTGLYRPHHYLLADFVERAATVLPQHHDSAQLIHEAVSQHILREKLRTISEVHFNALASIRWEQHGGRVVPGDVVSTAPAVSWDPYEGSADHLHGLLGSEAHPNWLDFKDNMQYLHELAKEHVTVVKDESEATKYTIQDVVLPFYGKELEALPAMPTHASGALFNTLAKELQISGVTHMRTAARAGYRRLVAKPPTETLGFYLVDEGRQWEWEEGKLGPLLKTMTYKDQDGVLRLRSPFAELAKKNMIARRGIRGEQERHFFLKPARGAGLTFCMQVQLARGTPITSAVREIFQFATLSPKAIYHLLKR